MSKTVKSKEDRLHKIPLRITDVTLRDSHQSLWATRMRTSDIMKIIDAIDSVGYYSLEVWGGATFDVCLRFLRENPWERLRLIKSKAKKTPLQMLLRGQNIVGYRNYADDLLDRFVALACENGIDIFRIFDALNDSRNLESAIRAVKKYGGHAQGTLSYTVSPVHTADKFVQAAKEQKAMGIDSLCIKDMAGILSPIAAERLVSSLVKELKIPIQMHCHSTSGMATPTYVEGVRAGAGAIDCAISSMAGFSSLPPVETLVSVFRETNYSANLDIEALRKVNRYFANLYPKRAIAPGQRSVIDPEVLVHQIPGGMISNFRSQLSQQNALEKLPQALEEVAEVRRDLGYPPLVTPTSQIVGTQAVLNVLSGERYKMVPNEVKNYVKGMYGRSPSPIAPEFIKKILGKEKPIDHRPADDIEPMLPKATHDLDPKLIEHEEDIVSYSILPEPALEYFKWRNTAPDQRPKIPADVEARDILGGKETPPAPKTKMKEQKTIDPILLPEDYKGISDILDKAGMINMDELSIQKGDFHLTFRSSLGKRLHAENSKPVQQSSKPEPIEKDDNTQKPEEIKEQATDDSVKHISAPFVGTFYSASGPGKPRLVETGKTVNAGDPVCIVEAMKLFNEIKAYTTCKILKFLVEDGQKVEKGQPMIAIEEL